MVQLPLHNALVIYQCTASGSLLSFFDFQTTIISSVLIITQTCQTRGGGKMGRGWGAKLILLCCSSQIRGENLKKGKSGGGLGMLEGQEG